MGASSLHSHSRTRHGGGKEEGKSSPLGAFNTLRKSFFPRLLLSNFVFPRNFVNFAKNEIILSPSLSSHSSFDWLDSTMSDGEVHDASSSEVCHDRALITAVSTVYVLCVLLLAAVVYYKYRRNHAGRCGGNDGACAKRRVSTISCRYSCTQRTTSGPSHAFLPSLSVERRGSFPGAR